jgi:crossover junction endodeoxyribonuclease RuvC
MMLFSIKELPKLLDATDALAVALCHHYQKGEKTSSKAKSWEAFVKDNATRVKS